ncbi:MAG: C40 family peptidase [Saprospiraceae bacterium]|nr:C40 family peptidase [Saprospiraceae bacterium]
MLQGSSSEQAKQGKKIKWQEVETGDLIFFTHNRKTVGHVALVLERKDKDILMIHATTSRGVVVENLLESDYWRSRILSASRLIL